MSKYLGLYLLHKDTVVIDLSTMQIFDKQLLPFGLYNKNYYLSEDSVTKWISKRSAPSNRKYADKIYQAAGQSRGNTEVDLMIQTHALSINDNYWIASKSELNQLNWNKVNLYNNEISKLIMQIAFTGSGPATISDEKISPEFTGQGTYAKCFRRNNGLEICKQGKDEEILGENLLSVAREANQKLGFDLLTLLYPMINKLPEKWQDPFYNRILYIVGSKTNQKDCY